MRNFNSTKGFTLIELMIVIVILGILAALAIPHYSDMVWKAKQARAKNSLAALRSAVSTYYADNEGIYPSANLQELLPKYLQEIPWNKLDRFHPSGNQVGNTINDDNDWNYTQGTGEVCIDCTHTDTYGVTISSW